MTLQDDPGMKAIANGESHGGNAQECGLSDPAGRRHLTSRWQENGTGREDLVFLCGHYEGIDERVLEEIVTDYVSIGDYVLTGGELPAMIMMDSISRMVPGVLHNDVVCRVRKLCRKSSGIPAVQPPGRVA